ncbi:MAG: lactate racemase domain-containing protein [Candidatus Geothermarchaeales archaeon]
MVEVRQKIPAPRIEDYIGEVRRQLAAVGLHSKVEKGMKIAITAGSRGITHISEILATVVDEVTKAGGEPFLIPSMGSHGGATPEGQVMVLSTLGVTSETVGAPIVSSMEVDEIGRLDNGAPVYVDRNALRADGIIVVNRVKPHTDYKDVIESGLMKMLAIGLGKQKGAEAVHLYLSEGYHKNIVLMARTILRRAPIMLGLAIVENAYREPAIIKAIPPERFEEEEKELLKNAKELIAKIPFKDIDVLIVEQMGKNISGTGMDTNVTGRFWIPGEATPDMPRIKRIVVLDLTPETYGNAIGIGLADVTTKRVFDKVDFNDTLMNVLTQNFPETGKIPIFLPTDRDAIQMALKTCGPIKPGEARVVRIKNTLELERFYISEAMMGEAEANPNLEVIGEPKELLFDILGGLVR